MCPASECFLVPALGTILLQLVDKCVSFFTKRHTNSEPRCGFKEREGEEHTVANRGAGPAPVIEEGLWEKRLDRGSEKLDEDGPEKRMVSQAWKRCGRQ